MQPFAHYVCKIPEPQQIGRAVERDPVLERKPLAGFHFVAERSKFRIFKVNLHIGIHLSHSASGERFLSYEVVLRRKTSAAQNTKNNTLTHPFIVKNAAFTRDKSFAFTRLCS